MDFYEICKGIFIICINNTCPGCKSHKRIKYLHVLNFLCKVLQCFKNWKHSQEGRPAGIRAKMNQLQDPGIIGELYRAGQAGVPISLNVRGLCCLRAGVPGLSKNIRVYSTLGRFLEHARIYRFENEGDPEFFIGSADWMRRNLDRRMETIMPVTNLKLKQELEQTLQVYENDNCSAWDMQPDGKYVQRRPRQGEERRAAQGVFIDLIGRQ